MLFTAPEQFVVLAMLLLGGLLIGFALAPSPKKWKRRVAEQSESFTEYHRDAEDRLRAANQRAADLKAEADALRADHADAERTIADLRAAATAAAVATAAPRPAPALSLVEPTPPAPVVPPESEPVAVAPPAPVIEPVVAPEPEPVLAPIPVAEPVIERAHSEQIVEAVPDPQLAAEIVPAPVPVPVEAVAPDPEPAAHEPIVAVPEPASEPAPEPLDPIATEAQPHPVVVEPETYFGTHDNPPAFQPIEVAPMTPTPSDAPPAPIGAAEPEMPSKGWFASSARDDLTRLRGVDDLLNTRLFGLGVTRFEDVEKLSAEDEMALEQRLSLPVGFIAREQWRTQAALLRAGQDEEHATHFAPLERAPSA